MESDIPGKHPSEAGAALKKWHKERFRRTRKYESRFSETEEWRTTFSLAKTHRRCFRHEPVHEKQFYFKKAKRPNRADERTQYKLRTSILVSKAAIQFLSGFTHLQAANPFDYCRDPYKLASMVDSYDKRTLQSLGGVDAIAEAVDVWMDEGVESSDLSNRKRIYGINDYGEKPSTSFLVFGREALLDPSLIILIVCSVVLIGMGLATKGWPDKIYDGFGILLSILLVVTVTSVGDYNESLQINDHDEEKEEIYFQVTRDGCRQKVSSYELVVGDVHLFIGDQVPADGIFISGLNLLLDESSLTGKSDPVHISVNKPFLLAGSIVQDGSATMLVTAVGILTRQGNLIKELKEEEEEDDNTFRVLQVELKDVASIIGRNGLLFSVLTFFVLTVRFLVGKAMRNEFLSWSSSDALSIFAHFATAVTIIVAAVAKGLPMAVKLSLAFAIKKLRNDNARVRNLSACEAMGFCTSICTDKTGILTTNCMVVEKIFVSGESKDARDSEGCVLSLGLSESVLAVLFQGIFKCTSSEVIDDEDGKISILGAPTETSILQYGVDLGGDFSAIYSEINLLKIDTFNPTKKIMSVIVTLPDDRTRAFCKGALEVVLGLCDKMIDVGGEIVPMSEENMKLITNVVDEFASDALRTLCLAYLDVEGRFGCEDAIPERGYTLVAVFGIKDPLKPGVKQAVETCLAAGIAVRMVTDDDINTAKVIAKQCGILTDGGLAINGLDLQTKNIWELKKILPEVQVMAGSSPTDKHELVKRLKQMSEVVAVVGDGTIYSPALQAADVGFAMGIAGTEVAKGQADAILMDDDFATIVKVVRWGRAVYVNTQKFVQFQLTVNIVALVVNLVSACLTGSAPLTVVQLLWVNLIMDTLGALALASEPPNDDLMKQPPVKRTGNILTPTMKRNIIGQSIYQIAVLFVFNFFGKPILNLHGPNATAILNTFIFNTFVFCQVFNEINSRDIDKINVFCGMFSSWVFMGVMISTVVFQVIIVEFLGPFASTVPLDWQLWVLSVVIGFVSMPISVVLKCISAVKKSHDN